MAGGVAMQMTPRRKGGSRSCPLHPWNLHPI